MTHPSTKIALVTGASRGIGAAIALELARQGYHVIGTATTDSGAQAITQALSAYPGCRGAALIVNDGAAVDALIDEIVKTQGGLHVLVNNAGITRDMLAMRLKDDDWDAVIDTNLKAVFRASRAAIRPMMKQRFGRIINITSVVGASGNPGQANYAAAKAGVAGMTRALARELGMALAPLAHQRGIALALEADTEVWLRGEPMLLHELIYNLVDNALAHTPGGNVVVRVLAPALLEVEDDGPGIPPEERERVFERFYRADTSGNIPGTGLGMCVVKEIVELHGGEVEVASTQGFGTTVTVWIPAAGQKPLVAQEIVAESEAERLDTW